jgi:5-formyltetrahydrofolate cyclo-ligase
VAQVRRLRHHVPMVDAAPDWSEVTAFRRLERKRLQALRTGVGPEIRAAVVANVDRIVDELLRAQPKACLAFYWPIRGELALFATMKRAVQSGAAVALPVVVDKQGPLQFRAWTPQTRMEQGVWSIPVPAGSAEVDPDVLFVPVVGFDALRYRLGNGGGFYDRTLAVRSPRPRTVGIGFECLRMPTIRPQPHDLPMDAMVTETLFDRGVLAGAMPIECASPPCSMPEPD